MRAFALLSITLSVFLLTACKSTDVAESSNVAQSEIHQAYYATYYEKENVTVNEAVFRFGGSTGTTLHLTEPSNLKLNDSVMEGYKEIFQGFIYRNRHEGFQHRSQFVFTDTEGKKYSNHCRIEGYTVLNVPEAISDKADSKITWEGPLPRGGELMSLQIYSDSGRTISVYPMNEDPHTFIIPASLLEDFPASNGNVAIERVHETRLADASHLGGKMLCIFKGTLHPVKINMNPQ